MDLVGIETDDRTRNELVAARRCESE